MGAWIHYACLVICIFCYIVIGVIRWKYEGLPVELIRSGKRIQIACLVFAVLNVLFIALTHLGCFGP